MGFYFLPAPVFAQQAIGIFQAQSDIGPATKHGHGTYIEQTQQYIISGAGYNVWFDHDEFHYVYRKIKGDFILYCKADLAGFTGIEQHRKVGIMARKSLDGNSAQVNAVIHGDGLTSLQYRKTAGAMTDEIKASVTHADIIQLERKGSVYTMRVAKFGEQFVTTEVSDLNLGDEVYIGLFAASHNADVNETGIFSNVRLTVPYAGIADFRTPMTLGSNLESLEVASGNREILYTVPYSIQGPNWTKDGQHIVFNDNKGLMSAYSLSEHSATVINTGTVKNNNNDHVLSFDGKMIGLSSGVNALGGSIIYTVPLGGGIPFQVTPKGPSYLHGWSPDGKYMVFCGERDGNFDIYRVPAKGGKEERLTTFNGLDDGPEYSPDGKFIYFNSVRSGLMQIWRMNADGSNQQPVTNDNLNNWFAHISPDGKSMVFISFLKEEVEPGRHPPYKHVYICTMPVSGGKPKVIAYLYGGQGSMNTPSWSPDGKKIAFVSNTEPLL